jgi:hypothetical protein
MYLWGMKTVLPVLVALLIYSCYQPSRECSKFKDGRFSFTTDIDGVEQTTSFTREGNLEVSEFQGEVDSASVRWINDCEYILKNLNPKSPGADKPIHMKILSTTEDSYTFEYKLVGTTRTSRGTAVKID